MHLELECAACCTKTCHDLTDEPIAPFDGMGDGATLEDTLYLALKDYGLSRCPDCGESLPITETAIGRLAQNMLLCW